jgi:hypothetical protein
MNDNGNFYIEVGGVKSNIAHFRGIASVTVDGHTYIGVSSYYEGMLPHEKVISIEEMGTLLVYER